MLFTNLSSCAHAQWVNDLRTLYTNNNAIIYAINLRTFNADDKNNNGLIEVNKGEESGNFINAIDRLDELTLMGVNTIHILPINPVGKTKALGTAGSLYATSSFDTLNPQLKSKKSKLSIEQQAKKFIAECHRRKIRVIVDLPSCGAYDLFMKKPELFVKDSNGNPVVPTDWTDVRLLDTNNADVYKEYQRFIDLMMDLGVDGIRADVATIKTYKFWKDLIDSTRKRDSEFLFLAEASDSWREPPSKQAVFTPYDKLLEAGFDGYYGSFFNLKDWKTSKDLISHVKFNIDLFKHYSEPKAVIGSFSTHDELSPILINGEKFSRMIMWLNATLPVNAYFVDGFATADTYVYPWANRKTYTSSTDDDYYFVHRGKIDIFNFSRRPGGKNDKLLKDFILSNKFKTMISPIISEGTFLPLKTSEPNVFAYANYNKNNTVLVIGNLDFKQDVTAKVNLPKVTESTQSIPIFIKSIPVVSKGKVNTTLAAGEIQVLLFNEFSPR